MGPGRRWWCWEPPLAAACAKPPSARAERSVPRLLPSRVCPSWKEIRRRELRIVQGFQFYLFPPAEKISFKILIKNTEYFLHLKTRDHVFKICSLFSRVRNIPLFKQRLTGICNHSAPLTGGAFQGKEKVLGFAIKSKAT